MRLEIDLTVGQVGDALSVSRETARTMCVKGEIPGAYKRGREWRVSRESLELYRQLRQVLTKIEWKVGERGVERVLRANFPLPVRVFSPEAVTREPPSALAGLPDLLALPSIAPPGVYFLCTGAEVVYVGQSANPIMRLGGHVDKIFDRAFLLAVPPEDLDAVEGAFIRLLAPRLNNASVPPGDPGRDRDVLDRYGFADAYADERAGAAS